MQTPNFPLQRFHMPSQSSQGHTTKQEVQHHFSVRVNTISVNYCISQAHLFYQDSTARSLCSCATKKWDVQWERWCCFKQNHKRGSHGNPLGLCLSTPCQLEAKSYFPTPLTLVSMEACIIANSSAWDLKRVLLALLWMEMDLSL